MGKSDLPGSTKLNRRVARDPKSSQSNLPVEYDDPVARRKEINRKHSSMTRLRKKTYVGSLENENDHLKQIIEEMIHSTTLDEKIKQNTELDEKIATIKLLCSDNTILSESLNLAYSTNELYLNNIQDLKDKLKNVREDFRSSQSIIDNISFNMDLFVEMTEWIRSDPNYRKIIKVNLNRVKLG